MAKRPNESDNANNQNEVGESLSSRIEEIGRAAYTVPAEERELRRRAKIARKGVNLFEQMTEEQRAYEPVREFYKRDVNTLSRTEPRIRIGAEARLERITQQAVNEIGRSFSERAVNRGLTTLTEQAGIQQASSMYASTDYTALYARAAALKQDIGALRGTAQTAAESLFTKRGLNPQSMAVIQGADRELQQKLKELAPINVAMRAQRAAGLDPESRMDRVFAKQQEAVGIISAAEGPKGGGRLAGLSVDQLKELEVRQAKKLAEAFKELEEAARNGATNLDDLQKKAEKTAENLTKTQDAIASAGGGGGRGPNWLGIAQQGFNAIGGAAMQIGVNQRLTQMQNLTGYADFQNQMYQTYKRAAGGDIASLMMLPQFAAAEDFGGELKTAANIAVGANTAASAAQGIAGGIEAYATGGLAGTGDIAGGIANTAVGGFDIARGVSGRQADIAGRMARLQVAQAVQAIGAEQLQGFRDYAVGLGGVANQMGTNGESFLQRNLSDDNLARIRNARLSPEQFVQQAAFGVNNIGSTFNESQIFASRNLERAGYGTMQDNMQRMATLANAGANNPQAGLQSVLENAFSKGLEGSKVLNAVVENTAAMAQSTAGAAMGVDTTAATAAMLAGSVDPNRKNQEFAVQRARIAQELTRDITTNTDVSYAGMVATARLRRTTGVSGMESILAEKLDVDTLRSLQGTGGRNISEVLRNRGINVSEKSAEDVVRKMIDAKAMTLLEGKGSAFATGGASAALLERIKTGKISKDDELVLGRIGSFAGFSGGQEFARSIQSLYATPSAEGRGKAGTAISGMGPEADKLRTSMDDLRTLGFVQLSTAAQTAAKQLGGAVSAVDKLTAAFKGLESAIPATEASAGTAASRSAGTGGGKGINTDAFNGAVDKLNTVLDKMISRQGGSPIPSRQDNRTRQAAPHQ